MPRRDGDFTTPTKTRLARRAAYLCAHPDCRRLTVGPEQGGSGVVTTGQAAHITAAAPGGPRYDSSLTTEQRRSQDNGIWLCAIHASQVDSDEDHFTTQTLRQWKVDAENAANEGLTTGRLRLPNVGPDTDAIELLSALGLRAPELEDLSSRANAAAKRDIEKFRVGSRWPNHPIALDLRPLSGTGKTLDAATCATLLQAVGDLTIIAPPGTGKSITAIQIASQILDDPKRVAALILLGEWSASGDSLLTHLRSRAEFATIPEQHFQVLAANGRLTLVLDGWNELDNASRSKAVREVLALRRDLPLVELVATTRRQALDIPLPGLIVAIEPLSQRQQLEIARAAAGTRGESIIAQAARTPGLRELVSIPLYLSALLRETPGTSLPTTREEVLRLFVEQHERTPENAEALREILHDHHADVLSALAVDATISGGTSIEETRARKVVSEVLDSLANSGQVRPAPQPAHVLDVLTNHHVLVRAPNKGGLSFHHQQFQEWYASLYVEDQIQVNTPTFESRVVDIPAWEEALLFACERLSRKAGGAAGVATLARNALNIDPLLAAEIVFRSSPDVWDGVRDAVMPFTVRWHTAGKVDRAIGFMVTSGRPDFADVLRPMIEQQDEQVVYRTLRTARRFRPAVLGYDPEKWLSGLPDERRRIVLTEIAYNSGPDGMELAARMARIDGIPAVRVSVTEALLFRGSEHLARLALENAPDEVFAALAKDWPGNYVVDPDLKARLATASDHLLTTTPLVADRISFALRQQQAPDVGQKIAELIKSPELDLKQDNLGWVLARALEKYPDAVRQGLVARLTAGLPMPSGSDNMLEGAEPIDDESATRCFVEGADRRRAEAAAVVAGPRTIATLIRKLIALQISVARGNNYSEPQRNEHYRIIDLLKSTRLGPFIAAWLESSSAADAGSISLLCDLLARHGDSYDGEAALLLNNDIRDAVTEVLIRWADALASDASPSRYELAEVAGAIARVRSPSLLQPLKRLFAEDRSRWREARLARQRGGRRGGASDAAMSFMGQYAKAFSRIGGDEVAQFMISNLADTDFGADAAQVLLSMYRARHPIQASSANFRRWDFSTVAARKVEKGAAPAPEAQAILAAASQLAAQDDEASRKRALGLARVALFMPCGDVHAVADSFLPLSVPIASKRELMLTLALNGVTVPAEMVLNGVESWLDAATKESWRREQNKWEIEEWLCLFPFSDDPQRLIGALETLGSLTKHVDQLSLLLTAISESGNVDLLIGVAERDPDLLDDHSWLHALLGHGSKDAFMRFFQLLERPRFALKGNRGDLWMHAERLGSLAHEDPSVRASLLAILAKAAPMPARDQLIERALASNPDTETILTLIARRSSVDHVDYTLHEAIENAAVEKRPVGGNSFELYSSDASELRRCLFEQAVKADGQAAKLAERSLVAIDRLRDEHGRPAFEPRHPDIKSGKPWPRV
jgi:hypothetical protein